MLTTNKHLTALWLGGDSTISRGNITAKGAEELAQALQQNATLTFLTLRRN